MGQLALEIEDDSVFIGFQRLPTSDGEFFACQSLPDAPDCRYQHMHSASSLQRKLNTVRSQMTSLFDKTVGDVDVDPFLRRLFVHFRHVGFSDAHLQLAVRPFVTKHPYLGAVVLEALEFQNSKRV